jgi:hypothetical protein
MLGKAVEGLGNVRNGPKNNNNEEKQQKYCFAANG